MNDTKEHMNDLLNELKQERDELRVKLNLAKLEANEEWQKLETKLTKLEAKAKQVGDATADAAGDVGAAAKLLAEEIREGFKKIVKQF